MEIKTKNPMHCKTNVIVTYMRRHTCVCVCITLTMDKTAIPLGLLTIKISTYGIFNSNFLY